MVMENRLLYRILHRDAPPSWAMGNYEHEAYEWLKSNLEYDDWRCLLELVEDYLKGKEYELRGITNTDKLYDIEKRASSLISAIIITIAQHYKNKKRCPKIVFRMGLSLGRIDRIIRDAYTELYDYFMENHFNFLELSDKDLIEEFIVKLEEVWYNEGD